MQVQDPSCLFRDLGTEACTANAGERLQELMAAFQEPVLGWFTYRADTNLTPSMREQVLAAFVARESAPVPKDCAPCTPTALGLPGALTRTRASIDHPRCLT